jgi:sigma-B regulation protein RsbU (phosphoserine phosphatase)
MEAGALPGPQALYDDAPCGLLVADAGGRLVRVNRTICRWLNHPAEALLAMRFHDVLTAGGRIFYQTHLGPLLRMQGSVAEVKLEFRTAGGESLPMMVNLCEGAGGGSPVVHIAAFAATDRHRYERELLAERRRAEDLAAQYAQAQGELAAARAQAEDRAVFAEQMVGIVSHDLRNPMSVIGMSSVVLGAGHLTAPQREVVARIDRSVKRAERLIADLLDFTQARLGSGIAVKREPTDVHRAVGECVAELAAAFPERAIVHERVGPGACDADAERIVQAVGNLVANAVHYGDPESPVTVRTEGRAHEVAISVHNAGPAIPPAIREGLFEPMIRGSVTGTGPRGVGLGLYIVREIAKAHGGTVQVQSSVGAGSTFTLALPRD